MSDTTEYVNGYLENSIGMLHDYLNQILQLKTQLKLVKDNAAKHNASLSDLQEQLRVAKEELETSKSTFKSQLDSSKNELLQTQTKDNETINKTREEAKKLEQEYNALKNKLNDFDALLKQFNDLKTLYKDKDTENQKLLLELDQMKASVAKKEAKASARKPINTKMDKVNIASTETDDF